MWPNPQETADLVTFTEDSLSGKLHFLYLVTKPNIFPNGCIYFEVSSKLVPDLNLYHQCSHHIETNQLISRAYS